MHPLGGLATERRGAFPLQVFLLTLALLAISQLSQDDAQRRGVRSEGGSQGNVGADRWGFEGLFAGLGGEAWQAHLQMLRQELDAEQHASLLPDAPPLARRLGALVVAGLQSAPQEQQLEALRRRIGDPQRWGRWLERRAGELQRTLSAAGIRFERIEYRVKDALSTWKKMQRKRRSFDEVHDVLAMRVVLGGEAEVYAVARESCRRFRLLAPMKDYIAQPKSNGYRSLHLLLAADDGTQFELQLRTEAMHAWAESQHWLYKAELFHASV